MNTDKEKIDMLLERNAADQLARVDWDKLNAAISARLDGAQRGKAAAPGWRVWLDAAAGIAAAAVIALALVVSTERPDDLQLPQGRAAVVRLVEQKGTAWVAIGSASSRSHAMVDIGSGHRTVARCDVQIIDANGGKERRDTRPAWIIITRPRPVYADNGLSRDMMDLVCLF